MSRSTSTDFRPWRRKPVAQGSFPGALNREHIGVEGGVVCKDLKIHRESQSTRCAERPRVWTGSAARIQPTLLDRSGRIEDDHVPFVELGLPAIDIIDLEYGPLNLYWPSRFDTVDKRSPTSLAIVGDVVIHTFLAMEKHDCCGP